MDDDKADPVVLPALLYKRSCAKRLKAAFFMALENSRFLERHNMVCELWFTIYGSEFG